MYVVGTYQRLNNLILLVCPRFNYNFYLRLGGPFYIYTSYNVRVYDRAMPTLEKKRTYYIHTTHGRNGFMGNKRRKNRLKYG